MPSILFVCTANRFRSPIAAIYFARSVVKQGDDNFISVSSAGTWTVPGQPVTTDALLEADKYALNLSLHKSRLITRSMLSKSDLILVMENNQKRFAWNFLILLIVSIFSLRSLQGDRKMSLIPMEHKSSSRCRC